MRRRDRPDIVLLNVMLPGIDGFEVARRLKQNEETRVHPIVMVSALQEVEDRVRGLDVGVDDFLIKPVEHSEIKARVRSLLKVKAYYDQMRRATSRISSGKPRNGPSSSRWRTRSSRRRPWTRSTRLTRAAEYKDEDTGAHIQRMSQYAATIARHMGMDDAAAEALARFRPHARHRQARHSGSHSPQTDAIGRRGVADHEAAHA